MQITSDIELSGAGCTTAITPNQLVQSSSENDTTKQDSFSAARCVLYCTMFVTHEGHDMSEATFTFRVDESLKTEFSTAAKARDRSSAQLLRDFMRDFVRQQEEAAAHDAWFRRQVQIGLDSANAGDVIPAAEVEAEAEAWRAETRRKMASVATS